MGVRCAEVENETPRVHSAENLVERLLALPSQIADAEARVVRTEMTLDGWRHSLQAQEDALLLEGKIDGKNAEARAAQIRVLTESRRISVSNAEMDLRDDKQQHNALLHEFSALKAAARLLAGGVA